MFRFGNRRPKSQIFLIFQTKCFLKHFLREINTIIYRNQTPSVSMAELELKFYIFTPYYDLY